MPVFAVVLFCNVVVVMTSIANSTSTAKVVSVTLIGTERTLKGLVWMCCDATDVCLQHVPVLAGFDVLCFCRRVSCTGASQIECLHGEWVAWLCCDATDVCLGCVLVKSSAYMGNSWF